MKTFYFNTGVRPFDFNPPAGMAFMSGFQDSGNGVYVIPFQCEDVSDEAIFIVACDYKDYMNGDNIICREIIPGSRLISKYAFFRIP